MKKFLLLILPSILLISCESNKSLDGTWKLESIIVESVDYTHGDRMQEYYPDIDQSTITFEGENKFTITQVCMKASGTIPEFSYEYKGNYQYLDGEYQFTIRENTKDPEENCTIIGTVTDNQLTLKKHFESMEMWIVGNEQPVDAFVTFVKQ